MGREIKRVALDFDWPLHQRWDGYVNPYYRACPDCKGEWDTCLTCNDSGIDPETVEAYEAWEETDPPVGEGWQIWETVSEGSPTSPVFATLAGLVAWLEGQDYSTLAATRFADGGWAPSAVFANGVMLADIESCAVMEE